MRAVVVGAGVGGLGAALALGRAGHEVTLLERDATPMPADAHAAFAWDRRGAPQVRHSHALLARLRNLLRDHHPDVLADLLDAGATEIRFTEMLPEEITDRAPRPDDDDLVALACRRTTFEWVLRRAALAEAHVHLHDGLTVDGLLFDRSADGPPRVVGVEVDEGNGRREIAADVVVVANGRRSPLPEWLADGGIELPEEQEDTGIVYYSRFYELRPDAAPPVQDGPIGGDLGYLKYAVFQGDNRTFSVTFATQSDDRDLRSLLLDEDNFDTAARLLPATAPWADAAVAEPITPVYVMAGLLNRWRGFLDGGAPRVVGVHAVGDAHTCTNPLYGRGCTLALVQAHLLADALGATPDDPDAVARAYEASSATEVEPWYHSSVMQDRQSKAWIERERRRLRGEDVDEGVAETEADRGDDDAGVAMIDLLRHGFFPATRTDPAVFRAFLRTFNLLDPPYTMLSDPEVMARVLAAYQERDTRPPEPPLGPPRREMLAGLGAA